KEYDERYAEFLAVAQELFYSKGYEQTSVQEIIDKVGVAKGTFYHYFGSKVDLLEALVAHLTTQAATALQPLVTDSSLPAMEKLARFFEQVNTFEVTNRDFLLDTMRVLYQEENVLLRVKVQAQSTALLAPLLAQIIHQGIDEGVFSLEHPDATAEILIGMGQGVSAAFERLIVAGETTVIAVARVKRKVAAYERGVERILGAPAESLCLIDPSVLAIWLPPVQTESDSGGGR
ncbi:MAG: TetR/AcrR family transcriptional regulator, partial [Caldilinea sp.]